METEARLPRDIVKGVAAAGVEGERRHRIGGIAADLISRLPVVVDIVAEVAVAAQPERIAVVLAGDKASPGRGDDLASGFESLVVVNATTRAAAERPRTPTEIEQIDGSFGRNPGEG